MHGEQGVPQEPTEELKVAVRRQFEAVPDLGRLGLGLGCFGQFIQGLGHEFTGRGTGKGQGDDLVRLDGAFLDLLVGEDLDDAVRKGERLARSGRG